MKRGSVVRLGEEMTEARERPLHDLADAPYGLVARLGDHGDSLAAKDLADRDARPFGDRADSAPPRLAPGTFGADVPSGFRLSFGLPGALGHDGGGGKDKGKDAFGVLDGEFTGAAGEASGCRRRLTSR